MGIVLVERIEGFANGEISSLCGVAPNTDTGQIMYPCFLRSARSRSCEPCGICVRYCSLGEDIPLDVLSARSRSFEPCGICTVRLSRGRYTDGLYDLPDLDNVSRVRPVRYGSLGVDIPLDCMICTIEIM